MILAIAILCVGGQRSNADIEARRHNAAYFSPTMERMMRATDKELLGYAGSLQPEMRGAAVSEIVDRKLKSAAPVLAKQLDPAAKDRNIKGTLQALTISALGRLRNPAAIPALRKTLKDENLGTRIASAYALANLNDKASAAGIRALFPKMKEPMLIPLVRKLGEFKDKPSEPTIRNVLLHAHYNALRAVAAESLGQIRAPQSLNALLVGLKDDYPDVRCASANALAKLGDPRAVPALKIALAETSPQSANAPQKERESKAAIEEALKVLAAG